MAGIPVSTEPLFTFMYLPLASPLLLQEEVAIEHLKHRILEVTGNIHFYKSGDEYVITQRSPSETKAKVPCLVEREIEDDDEW